MAVSYIFKQSNMSMGNVSVEYLILVWKALFKMRVPTLGFSLCKTNETFWNEMTCRVSAKPWFIYRIKIVYARVFLYELT